MDEDYSDLLAIRDSGDSDALRRLMARHKESIFRFVYRISGNEADAAEITEDVFLKVFFNAHKYRIKGKVKAWIFTIAANASRDHLRRHKKRARDVSFNQKLDERTELGDILASGGQDIQIASVRKEQMEMLQSAIRDLPERYRVPFVFCKLEGHSYQDCAEMLGTTPKIVEMKIYRAKKKLMKQLQNDE